MPPEPDPGPGPGPAPPWSSSDPGTAANSGDPDGPSSDPPPDVWSWLPRLPARQVRLEAMLDRWSRAAAVVAWLDWLRDQTKLPVALGRPEIVWRAAGLRRAGLIAQFRWASRSTKLAVGLEVPLAHAVVDAMLAYQRPLAESRLQLTPVEWGVWSYLAVRALEDFTRAARTLDPAGVDLVLDRVSPDPFDPAGLGSPVTVLWPFRVGSTTGTIRLWLPESCLEMGPDSEPVASSASLPDLKRAGECASTWYAEAGHVIMPRGLSRLRNGGVLPLADSRLTGTAQSPAGPIALICDLARPRSRFQWPAEPVPGSQGRLVRLTAPCERRALPRDPLALEVSHAMTPNSSHPTERTLSVGPSAGSPPADVPVTLTVELGRVSLTLDRLADLRPGDVIELGRHSREPVELTSGGRLVARGELVLIDTELGVRVTNVFL